MFTRNRIAAAVTVLGLTGLGVMAAPPSAQAWWAHGGGWGWHGGLRLGVVLPPVVVAPPYYAPPPVAYYPPPPPVYYTPRPRPAWVPAHWRNGYWVPGHWS